MGQQRIVLAGATGNLGSRIARALRQRGTSVRAIVRRCTNAVRLARLREDQVQIVEVDLGVRVELVRACEGASCVVSTLLGLDNFLIDAQGALLDAAIEAGVPRFIPSDYAMDFTKDLRSTGVRAMLRQPASCSPRAPQCSCEGTPEQIDAARCEGTHIVVTERLRY